MHGGCDVVAVFKNLALCPSDIVCGWCIFKTMSCNEASLDLLFRTVALATLVSLTVFCALIWRELTKVTEKISVHVDDQT